MNATVVHGYPLRLVWRSQPPMPPASRSFCAGGSVDYLDVRLMQLQQLRKNPLSLTPRRSSPQARATGIAGAVNKAAFHTLLHVLVRDREQRTPSDAPVLKLRQRFVQAHDGTAGAS